MISEQELFNRYYKSLLEVMKGDNVVENEWKLFQQYVKELEELPLEEEFFQE